MAIFFHILQSIILLCCSDQSLSRCKKVALSLSSLLEPIVFEKLWLYQINSLGLDDDPAALNICSEFNHSLNCQGLFTEKGDARTTQHTFAYNAKSNSVVRFTETVTRLNEDEHIYKRETSEMVVRYSSNAEDEDVRTVPLSVKKAHRTLYALIAKGEHWMMYRTCNKKPIVWVMISDDIVPRTDDSIRLTSKRKKDFKTMEAEVKNKINELDFSNMSWKYPPQYLPFSF